MTVLVLSILEQTLLVVALLYVVIALLAVQLAAALVLVFLAWREK